MSDSAITPSEQEHLKQIFLHTGAKVKTMHTKDLAFLVNTKPASVSDMIKRLAVKGLVLHNKHYGCSLSEKGLKEAIRIVRRNRLWELFLVDKLGMDWKEIGQIATMLQSLTSDDLTDKLSAFLGNPTYDPHGEAIPDHKGNLPKTGCLEVYDLKLNETATVFGYRDTSTAFLEYIEKLKLLIGSSLKIVSILNYDHSLEVLINNNNSHILSKEIAQKIFVKTT